MNTVKTRGWSIERKLAYYSVPGADGCILWTLTPNSGGYGQIWTGGRYRLVHRVVLEHKLGRPIEHGKEACHSCHSRLCINPSHLREDTHRANIDDRQAAWRHAYGERVGGARLKAEQIPAIRKDPRSERVIAASYGVASTVIGAIRRGANWRHVP